MSSDDVKMEPVSRGKTAAEYGLPNEEILAEVPVFLTQKLARQLHLLQYPQKNSRVQPGELNPREARIKPIHGKLEMDIPLDVESPMYNEERGRELGVGLGDGRQLLDITTLDSVNIPQNSEYLAGIMQNGELHLTAIDKITQLRPSLRYLDKVAERALADSKLEEEEEGKAQSVQVTIRSAQAEEALRQQQNSIAFMQQKLEEEPWSDLAYYDVGTSESTAMLSRLVADNREPLVCKTDADEYLNLVIGSTAPDIA
ncbi:hypothetical protein LPJ78_003824 [Coemansia sp. RSA 989]|nr:DNA-directed RNA polymerase III subunit Rpc5 [Coemansia mojavensis]KAJ1741008.1 hypothetical protein LPJ68_003263 [Coemansia sp. RSA 1086]KAJ1749370.1 hypothetical protein LPJ79_003756 [Coemansia sp. RSA 1821]KAJ1863748.1 hypothetical protein LPJ78_003824 [Coemansia sp. RSA 989]KAJ1871578.1 hypothetical protein LPJ55_003760 [Coemansia sp. RSA 990]KAJ2649686.1 hypothetical protein IWW40_003027 [Coemansia sp. RSA 1250]KAJ2671633.1 hypothetical protein IWW42_003244 [Coemansia sp. RSA 1085]